MCSSRESKTIYSSPIPEQLNDFYESHEYRKQWDYDFTPDSIHAKYDHEQNERISRIGIENIRGKSVFDLGASAGVFLDAISSSASRTIAIEPAGMYKEYLQSQGHAYYSYPEDACRENEKVGIISSFDVIEHVEKPKEFLSYAYELLKP
jgi:2-polyprenyl-3-methyl-5-hydroxy-6-metoxy-1,4-benzoquinol methylase